jgi:uncharacterized protein YkwD
MPSTFLAPARRRLASVAFGALIAAAIALPPGTTATTTPPVDATVLSAAEASMVSALNADRTALGLIPVRVDSRLMAIARARSNDMVAKGYFSHTQPDGRNVFDILSAQHITWYTAGEIIAWNNYPMDSTVNAANRQWVASPTHYSIIKSTSYNYVGVGLAIDPDTGKKIWTAVYLKGPDRTGARATTYSPAIKTVNSTTRSARLTWNGSDVRLQVLTAGLANFKIQRRIDDGSWVTLTSATTLKATTYTVHVGHRYEFRIAARDKKGNLGAWATRVVDLR